MNAFLFDLEMKLVYSELLLTVVELYEMLSAITKFQPLYVLTDSK